MWPQMEEWGQNQNGFQNKTQDKLADGVCKYKSTLIDKGLNYFISVKLLILKTIVSQRLWSKTARRGIRCSNVLKSSASKFSDEKMIQTVVTPYKSICHKNIWPADSCII